MGQEISQTTFTPEDRRRYREKAKAGLEVLAAMVAAAALVGCGAGVEDAAGAAPSGDVSDGTSPSRGRELAATGERGPVPLGVLFLDSDRLLFGGSGTCNGNPIVEVTEYDDRVEVLVTALQTNPGPECDDGVAVELVTDLGDRVIYDAATGKEVEVLHPGS